MTSLHLLCQEGAMRDAYDSMDDQFINYVRFA